MANTPTPQNILTITYQLLQEVNDPASVRAQLPILTVQFQDSNSVVRNKIIGFQEMLPYLRYLHVKALSLGKVIVCDPESTFDKKIVFTIGDAEAITVPGQITIVTPGSLVDAAFTLVYNLLSVTGNVLQASNTPSIVQFSLPIINGGNVYNDYSFATSAGLIGATAVVNAGNWDITLFVFNNGAAPTTTTVTVTTVGSGAVTGNVIVANCESNNAGTIIDQITLADPITNIGISANGYNDQSGSAFPVLVSPINNGQASLFRMVNSVPGVRNGSINLDVVLPSASNLDIVAYGKSVIRTNFGFPSTGNYDVPFTYEPTEEGFVLIEVYNPSGAATPPPPVGVPVSAKTGVSSGTICTQANITVYTDDGTIGTGKTLFDDAAMTTPHAGDTFVVNPVSGITYNVNPVSGVVGAAAGVTCVPANPPKNVFIVNQSGQPIVVTSDQGSQAFAPAMNGNVGVSGQGFIKNDSLTIRTFKFLRSMPIYLDPDIALPNPRTLAIGAQVNLSADISNLNYIVVT